MAIRTSFTDCLKKRLHTVPLLGKVNYLITNFTILKKHICSFGIGYQIFGSIVERFRHKDNQQSRTTLWFLYDLRNLVVASLLGVFHVSPGMLPACALVLLCLLWLSYHLQLIKELYKISYKTLLPYQITFRFHNISKGTVH